MGIHVADTAAHQSMTLNEQKHFFVSGGGHLGQIPKQGQHTFPIPQISAGQFANHHGVNQYLIALQQCGQAPVPITQMIDPD